MQTTHTPSPANAQEDAIPAIAEPGMTPTPAATLAQTMAGQPGADGTHYRICPLCEACCGLNVTVEAGRVTRIVGAAQDVFSRGYLCPKGYALKELHEDPDRLRQPLIKRNGQHQPATWEIGRAHV